MYTIIVPNEQQYQQLLELARQAGLEILTEEERQHHLRIVAQGGSGKSIPDPLAWQREIRADRPLPGRD